MAFGDRPHDVGQLRRTDGGSGPSSSCSSKIAVRIRAIVPSSSSTARRSRAAASGFSGLQRPADPVQRQRRGEDPLHDVVVQVAGDAVPVGLQPQLPLPLLGARQLEDRPTRAR